MFFRQVLHPDLGCASYVVADGGQAAVVDPKWEIEEYLALAEDNGFAITHIFETHNHADHVSGRGRLVEATGATVHVSADAGVEYEHEPLREGDGVELGAVRIECLPTPGHRPEHIALLVEDMQRSGDPWLVLTGDSLFVGDIARPDLAVEKSEGARSLFRSLHRLLELGDFVEVWPGHIGGSLCGSASMSMKPGSTIGYERRFNPLLTIESEAEFVTALTSDLAPKPPNFERIVALNRGPLLRHATALDPFAPQRVRDLVEAGVPLIDGRETREFDAAHVPGSINVTMTRSAVGTRAAWAVDPEEDVVVTAATDAEAVRLARRLEAVGFRKLRGYLAGGIAAWETAGLPLQTTRTLEVPELAEALRRGDVRLLDVRDADEWRTGHVAGSLFRPYRELGRGAPIPDDLRAPGPPWAIGCSAGNRSAIAASLLRRAGFHDVAHVAGGGIAELPGHGIELVQGE